MESYSDYLERISIPDSFAYSLNEECNHIFSDFYPSNANGDLIKFCFRCKGKFGKKDFIKYKKIKRKRIFEMFKCINNIHIDLFW